MPVSQSNEHLRVTQEIGYMKKIAIAAFMIYLDGSSPHYCLTLLPIKEEAGFPSMHFLWKTKRETDRSSYAIECDDSVALAIPRIVKTRQ